MSPSTTTDRTTADGSANSHGAALPRLLLRGFDTIQCCFYLAPTGKSGIDVERMLATREGLRTAGAQDPTTVELGNRKFLLAPHGSRSGYPFILSDLDFRIEFGPAQNPPFFVTFRSEALWRESAAALRDAFLGWAASVGYFPQRPETMTRIDFAFDIEVESLDFGPDDFVTMSSKDAQYRENGAVQTFTFGRSDAVLRVYDKVAEIEQQSEKVWLFALWGQDRNVWRIEYQVRKDLLREYGILTFEHLARGIKPLLRYLAAEHDTLRVPSNDSNRSRWPLHPLWTSVQRAIEELDDLTSCNALDQNAVLEHRLMIAGISVYGYLKRIAALRCVLDRRSSMQIEQALAELKGLIRRVDNPLSWQADVTERIEQIRLGRW